ncbi:MAG: nuclear transport factor 2 family protein [bacterium]|nr:nuclear transport factor 2 family protein [bacterium]
MSRLESEVRALRDQREIQELRFRYHIAVNERRIDEIPALFCEEGEAHFGEIGSARGRAEIATFYHDVVGGSPFIKQFIHNHVIQISGDRATGLSYLEAKTVAEGESLLVAARFDDEYVRLAGGWHFRMLRLTPFFVTPLREGWSGENELATR